MTTPTAGQTQSAKLPTTVEEAKDRSQTTRKDRYQRAADLVRGALESQPPTSWEEALHLLNRTPRLRKAQVKVVKNRGKVAGKRLVVTLHKPGARPFDAQRGGGDSPTTPSPSCGNRTRRTATTPNARPSGTPSWPTCSPTSRPRPV